MDVSIILVSYNTKDMTRDCLKSIYKFTKDIDFEVFVVDNNSHDGSAEMIEKEFPQVKLIRNSENKGFGAANNIAIRQSSAKYIFCLNTDTVLLSNAIKAFYDFMEKDENKQAGACGCQLLDKDKKLQHSYAKFPCLAKLISMIFFFHKVCPNIYLKLFVNSELENNIQPYYVDYITGADLFIRKSVINECGMFDEDFFMYSEEVEMQFRYKKLGYKSVIIPDINIIHYCGVPKKEVSIQRLQMIFKSEILYYKKCHGLFISKLAKLLYIIKFIITPQHFKRYKELIKIGFGL